MKVIDLLNKIANDKDYRPTVKFLGTTYTYDKIIGKYKNARNFDYGIFVDYVIENILNDEVEVIEENKEIEELGDGDTYDFNHLELKINELVRAVNKINKEREEK